MAIKRKIPKGMIQLPDGRVVWEDFMIDGVAATEVAAQQEASGKYDNPIVKGGEIRQEDRTESMGKPMGTAQGGEPSGIYGETSSGQEKPQGTGIRVSDANVTSSTLSGGGGGGGTGTAGFTGNFEQETPKERERGIRVSDANVNFSTLSGGGARTAGFRGNPGTDAARRNSDAEVNEKSSRSSDGGGKSDPINGNYKPGGLGGEFRFRSPAQVLARVRQGQTLLNEPTRKAMAAAAQTGAQVNEVRSTREAEMKEAGVDPARARVLANMEAQNLLRAGKGLPQFKESDIVTGPDGKPSLSTSSRDARIFGEQRGAATYRSKSGDLLGRSIRQPDGQIAFSTTRAGREHLGTEGRDRFAGIGDGFGGEGENPMDRAIVERNSQNGVINRAGIEGTRLFRRNADGSRGGQVMHAAGDFAGESLDRLGAERRAEFTAGMTGRAANPNASVGQDATGRKRTAADLLKRNKKKGVTVNSAATGGRDLPTENVFSFSG